MSAWMRLGWFVALLMAMTGCESTNRKIKPAEFPEEFVAPPLNDSRYIKPVQIPEDQLQNGIPKRRVQPIQPGPGPGAMPGGGPGGGIGYRGLNGGY